MATAVGDILLNAKPYKLVPGGWDRYQSPRSQAGRGGIPLPEFEQPDNWLHYGQSEWYGMGEPDWLAEGPFNDGWGIDLSEPGKVKVARKLALVQADAANIDGYAAFTIGTSWDVKVGRTNGTSWRSANGIAWTSTVNALGVGVTPRGHAALYKDRWYIGGSNGRLYSTVDGVTYADHGLVAAATAAYVLGVLNGKLYIGQANDLRTWDGTAFAQTFVGQVSGTPSVGAVGNSMLHIMTLGPSSTLYVTDGYALYNLAQLADDFLPKKLLFSDTLYAFGHLSDDPNTEGDVWRLEGAAFTPIMMIGDDTADYGIRDALSDGGLVYFGVNRYSGLGVYDPGWDLFDDAQMGFYVGSVITTVQGVVDGISQFQGRIITGIAGNGIYRQDTPGTFKMIGSRFDGGRRNIRKLWDAAQIRTSTLLAGQSVTFAVIRQGETEEAWGSSAALVDRHLISPAADFFAPWLAYVLTGDANGQDMDILDVAVSYIDVPEDPKHEWDIVIDVAGSTKNPQRMRDGTANTRTSVQQLADLNALENTRTTYEDVDGTAYNVLVKAPRVRDQDLHRRLSGATVADLRVFYRLHLSEV